MIDDILISVGGLCVGLKVEDPQLASKLRERYGVFLSHDTPLLTVEVVEEDRDWHVSETPAIWPLSITFSEGVLGVESLGEEAHFDLNARKGRLVKAPFVPGENSMRVMFAWLCVLDGGLLVHSCGVVKDGGGYLFFGHSGAGKSTVAGLSRRFTILSDDMVMVRRTNGGFQACGVPFRGEVIDAPLTNEQAPLKGVFRLVKDTGHYLEPVSRPTMVASLLASVPFMTDQIDLGEKAAASCAQLLASVPYGRLHFRRDEGFWEVVSGTSRTGRRNGNGN